MVVLPHIVFSLLFCFTLHSLLDYIPASTLVSSQQQQLLKSIWIKIEWNILIYTEYIYLRGLFETLRMISGSWHSNGMNIRKCLKCCALAFLVQFPSLIIRIHVLEETTAFYLGRNTSVDLLKEKYMALLRQREANLCHYFSID